MQPRPKGRACCPQRADEINETEQFERILNSRGALGTARPTFRVESAGRLEDLSLVTSAPTKNFVGQQLIGLLHQQASKWDCFSPPQRLLLLPLLPRQPWL